MKVTREMVDKDLRGRYAAGRIIAGFFHTRWFSLLVLRFSRAVVRGKNIRGLVCRERHIPSRNGGAPIRVRVYRPTTGAGTLPVILSLHGRGFVPRGAGEFRSILKHLTQTEPCITLAPG